MRDLPAIAALIGFVLGVLFLGPALYDWTHDPWSPPAIEYTPSGGPPCVDRGCPGPPGPTPEEVTP